MAPLVSRSALINAPADEQYEMVVDLYDANPRLADEVMDVMQSFVEVNSKDLGEGHDRHYRGLEKPRHVWLELSPRRIHSWGHVGQIVLFNLGSIDCSSSTTSQQLGGRADRALMYQWADGVSEDDGTKEITDPGRMLPLGGMITN